MRALQACQSVMDHLSPELTELLERAAARNLVDYVSSYRGAYPALEATAMPLAGGTAAFTGDASPLTTIKGAGPDITDDQLELVEAFLRGRGARRIVLEAAPWITAPTLARLRHHGYQPGDAENVVICTETGRPGASASGDHDSQLDLLGLQVEEVPAEEWPALMRAGFGLADDDVGGPLSVASAQLPRTRLLGVRDEQGAWIACAQASDCGAAMILGCDATIPRARGRGAQQALIRARLDLVRRGVVAVAEVSPGGGSERNYLRSGFSIAYQRRHYLKALD